jgi:hypothetical protein
MWLNIARRCTGDYVIDDCRVMVLQLMKALIRALLLGSICV